jgi:SAM-dependent methyltransferase
MQTVETTLADTGERMIPPSDKEISFVFARHRFAYQYVSQFVKDSAVVDIGCGTGYGCKLLSERARFVCGIDYDFSALSYCKSNFSGKNIDMCR